MNVENLVTMANQIGSFFETQGTYEEGVASVAEHLRKYWEPRMLKRIGEYVRDGGEGLHPAVLEAIKRAAMPKGTAAA